MEGSDIATIILVATAVMLGVSASYWMGGMTSMFTKFEKVEVSAPVCVMEVGANGAYWRIDFTLKNSGPKPATITDVYLNGKSVEELGSPPSDGSASRDLPAEGYSLQSGASVTFSVYIDVGYGTLSSGTTVQIKLRSTGGVEYPKMIILS